ncbi:MAG: hypothetical protein ACYS4W_10790 [Planctomycetota bacterium]|jgi:hypothetical protein
MKVLTLLLFLVLLLASGCSYEPYPGWVVRDVQPDAVPRRIMKAFNVRYPDAEIERIEQSTFGSRHSGYPKLYRFTFCSMQGQTGTVILDEEGELSDLEFWFGAAMTE